MKRDEIRNSILKRLPDDEFDRFAEHAEFVLLDHRDTVIVPNQPISIIDFVETGMHSMLSTAEGEAVEVATVGYDGFIGIPLVLRSSTTICTVFCQVPGSSWRLSAEAFKQLLDRCPTLLALCQRYAFSVFEQAAQNSACNRLHSIEERCAKWLLLSHDRMESDEFDLTQEFLAQMLGVRRASVSLAASTLQHAGLIKYTRGRVAVLERKQLEEVSCPCYRIIHNSLAPLLA